MSVIEKDALDQVKADTEKIIEDVAAVKVSADKAANKTGYGEYIDDEIVEIPDNFFSMENNSFLLTKASFANAETVGDFAFRLCNRATTINMPKVKKIGENAFNSCASLLEFDFSNVEEIEYYAFGFCSSLKEVNAPKLTILGAEGRQFASNLKLESVYMPLITNLSFYAFGNCHSIKEVTQAMFPLLTTLEGSAFYSCNSLSYVNFTEVTSLGANCFYQNKSLEKVDLSKIKTIDDYCFSYCTSLKTLIIRTSSVCSAGTNIFANISPTPNIYVPDALVSQYKKATNWSSYASYIKPLSEYVEG